MVSNTRTPERVIRPAVVSGNRDGGESVGPVDSWQMYLVEVAYHLRQVVADDPDALRTLASTPRAARWLRPPVGDLVLVEEFLASMHRYGFSDEDAAAIYLAFFTRLLGFLTVQATCLLPSPSGLPADVSAYPTLTRLYPLLRSNRDKEDFDCTLDDIITALERDLRR